MSVFTELNEGKVAWAARIEVIKATYPSTARLDWFEVFRQDPASLGKLINDIIKLDQTKTGKPGKRPSLEEGDAADRLRKLQDEDYTILKFPDALKVLAGVRSIRGLSVKLDLDKSYVYRLLRGEIVPTAETMEHVARKFNKEPSYFVEYRIGYILAMIDYKLTQSPETSILFYKRVVGRNEKVA